MVAVPVEVEIPVTRTVFGKSLRHEMSWAERRYNILGNYLIGKLIYDTDICVGR